MAIPMPHKNPLRTTTKRPDRGQHAARRGDRDGRMVVDASVTELQPRTLRFVDVLPGGSVAASGSAGSLARAV